MRPTESGRVISMGIALGLAVCSSPQTLRSATLVVSQTAGSPHPTIQSAVDAAVPGQDDVFVSCGRYSENVTMRDGVSVRGENPRCAILQGSAGSSGPAVTFPALVSQTELSGLTVRGGASNPAISGQAGPMVIARNVIEQSRYGIVVADTTSPATPVITRNVIRGNGEGGVLLEAWHPSSTLTMTANLVVESYVGAYIEGGSAAITLANNTIVRNAGGGVSIYSDSGGGNIAVANNVVAWNGGAGGIVFIGSDAPRILANDVWSNTPVDLDVSTGDPSPFNFSQDPLFLNEVRDFVGYEPRTSSPLIDRADPAFAPARDLRGVPRVSGRGCMSAADVGAREAEGITGVRWVGRNQLSWDTLGAPCNSYREHQVLRGDLGVLRATGVYRQNPAQLPAAATWCELNGDVIDGDTPEGGEAFFYLVNGWGYCETPLGFTSDARLRPGYVCWAPCPVGSQ